MTDPIGNGPLRDQLERRQFMMAVAGGLLAAPLAAEAQPAGKVWRIGFLWPGLSPANPAVKGPFRQGLGDLGYVEGRDADAVGVVRASMLEHGIGCVKQSDGNHDEGLLIQHPVQADEATGRVAMARLSNWLIGLLLLASVGCATAPPAPPTVDVTGNWVGTWAVVGATGGDLYFSLQQNGAQVTGTVRMTVCRD